MNEWTPREDKMLRKYRPLKTFPQLAKMMNRSEHAVRLRSNKLGLKGPAKNHGDALCWDCQKACGGCSWSSKLQPVDGWTAKKTKNELGHAGYLVLKCPEFVPDEKREVKES